MLPPMQSRVSRQIKEVLGDRATTERATLSDHGHDVSRHQSQPPDLVAFPVETDEVASIVRICFENDTPIIPYGTGTAVEGGVVATRGGVCINLSRMNQIVRLSVDDADVTVQAGVTRKALNDYLIEHETGLTFTVDPGADASLGGMAATNASGSTAVRYGTMRENVMGLTVVMADGTIIHTGGRARKASSGYDLTRLMGGSEGSLGIITEVTLRLQPMPAAVSSAVCPFPDIERAVSTVIAVLTRGIPIARIELLDEVQIDAVNRYSDLENEIKPTLFFEFHGSDTQVAEHARTVEAMVAESGGGPFEWSMDETERQKLWQARHDGYYASLALRDGSVGYVTDVCVPISELAACIVKSKEILANSPIPAPLFGHVGDGNYHVVFPLDPASEEELQIVSTYHQQLVDLALSVGGTCTGEHGIGIGKLDAVAKEHGAAISVMQSIKQALDPKNILNPGKAIPES